jgi:rod shape-determining protein MreC
LLIENNNYHYTTYLNFVQKGYSNYLLKKERFNQYLKLKTVNDQLLAENEELRNQLSKYQKNINRLNEKSFIDSTTGYRYICAKVINNSVNKPYNYISIDKGEKDGIRPEMAVICDRGIVGIVDVTSDHFAIVIPIINKKMKVSAKFKKNNYFGSFEWSGSDYQTGNLNEIPLHVNVEIGDTIVTSGFSNIFPEGIPIGTVKDFSGSSGTFYNISVKLIPDFKNLFYVYILEDKEKIEKTALENKTQNE